MAGAPLIGVLALQGGFDAHERVLRGLGARVREVRVPGDLEGLEGLVIPGGESTTMTLGIEREGLREPLRELLGAGEAEGIPVLGSCAGLIMLDRDHLGLMDMRAQRNAFGRQLKSFEADIELRGMDGHPTHPDPTHPNPNPNPNAAHLLRAVFIRAPWIAEYGPDVEILAEVDGHAVAARQEGMLAVAFHAELTEDDRVHRMFLESVGYAPPASRPGEHD
jgi:5'-phosphate synthase pdxT subunit